jgi:alpha-tubulin suppressor-like RCC1 family protein
MKRILIMLVNASLCGFLMAGGTLPVRANSQPVSQSHQLAVVGTVIYLPLVFQGVPPPVPPTVDVRVNGSDGPVNLTNQSTFTVSWTSTGDASCTGSAAMAGQSGLSGSYTDGPKATGIYTYTMSCSNAGGTAADSVVVNVGSSTVTVTSISAGEYHTCALTAAGGVKCWGYNQDGELGNGTKTDSPVPVDVVGLASGVDSISAGYKHTCALMKTGGIKCWGFNADGQLGNGTRVSSSTPVDVYNIPDGVDIRAGGFHTCALKATGVFRCWGDNAYGQLADGSTDDALTSVKADQLPTSVRVIRLGQFHTCFLTATNGVQCLGNNSSGQLGDGTTTNSLKPVSVNGLASGASVLNPGGSHTCTLNAAIGVMCWGYNGYGQLGDGTTTDRHSPVTVTDLASGVRGVSAGLTHTCALKTNDVMKCWGFNYYGQLGDGTTTNRLVPVTVNGLVGVPSSIRVGYSHTCALMQGGGVRCWGSNEFGQLGNGLTSSSSVPVIVIGFP